MKDKLNSEWILANAGSGKTTALTERVVRLLLLGVPAEKIVCITYTKAAAAEMHARVLKMLRELLLMDEKVAREKIAKLTGVTATDAMFAHARGLFGTVLGSPSGGVMLTTIHGFCQNILRRFPMEAGIAPQFTVLEDAAADERIARAKRALLTGIASADPLLRAALSLIGARGGEYGFETLASDIISNRRHWVDIWRAQSADSLRAAIFAFHGIEENLTTEALDRQLCYALTAEQETALRTQLSVMLTHKKKTEQKYGLGLSQWLESEIEQRTAQIPALLKLFLTGEGELRADVSKLEAYEPYIAALAQAVLRYHQRTAALACAEESVAIALLARALLDLYAAGKAAIHALDYDDLIDHTLRLCAHPETLGWVMSKLDDRIDHLLIDEAQDNSGAQWQLARLLVEELIASNDGVGQGGLPRSLLVVGDEKQSIYSFQGAAPEQFQRYRAAFGALLTGSPSPMAERSLEYSYRSAQAILTLVDTVCAQPDVARALTKGGEIHRHKLKRSEAAGRVVLHPPIFAPETAKLPAMVLPTEYSIATDSAQLLAEEIAGKIAEWVRGVAAKSPPPEGEGRGGGFSEATSCPTSAPLPTSPLRGEELLSPGDILILVHKRKPLVAPLIRALQRRGIPVAGMDRLVLSDHLAVRDLLALMAWCDHVRDDLALAQILRSPLIGISDETLRAHAYNRAGSLWDMVRDTYPWLSEALAHKQDTPYDFLTWVLEISGCRRDFARRFGEEIHEVLDELKAQAAAMSESEAPTLAQFHDCLSKSTRHIKREQESAARDQVRIMTVHGAKGLEARVVILADTVNVPTTQRERSFMMRNAQQQKLPVLALSSIGKSAARLAEAKSEKTAALMEEYQRLLYVALTRARDELHIFGHANKSGEVKAGSWYETVRTVMRVVGREAENGAWLLEDMRDGESGSVAPPLGGSQIVLHDLVGGILPQTPTSEIVSVTPHQIPRGIWLPPKGGATEPDSSTELESLPLPSWLSTLPTPAMRNDAIAPSRMEATAQPSPYVAQASREAKERGVRIHRVLELLRADSPSGLIANLIGHLAPEWSATEKAQATQEIATLHREQNWLFAGERMAEVSITGMIDERVVHGQIDLLVKTENGYAIIDYKTGRNIPENADAIPDSYRTQLAMYRALVQQLYPHETIRTAILWTHGPRLMWVGERAVIEEARSA